MSCAPLPPALPHAPHPPLHPANMPRPPAAHVAPAGPPLATPLATVELVLQHRFSTWIENEEIATSILVRLSRPAYGPRIVVLKTVVVGESPVDVHQFAVPVDPKTAWRFVMMTLLSTDHGKKEGTNHAFTCSSYVNDAVYATWSWPMEGDSWQSFIMLLSFVAATDVDASSTISLWNKNKRVIVPAAGLMPGESGDMDIKGMTGCLMFIKCMFWSMFA